MSSGCWGAEAMVHWQNWSGHWCSKAVGACREGHARPSLLQSLKLQRHEHLNRTSGTRTRKEVGAATSGAEGVAALLLARTTG